MRAFRLTLECSLSLVILATPGCGRKSNGQIIGEAQAAQTPSPPVASNSPPVAVSSPSPSQTVQSQASTLDSSRLDSSVRPAVFLLTVFDSSGKLLRTETAFFISGDGKFITTARAIEHGINAVAKTADGGIHNVSGILASSAALDLAVLQADVKSVPFLTLNKSPSLETGTQVQVVGSALAGLAEAVRGTKVSGRQSDRLEVAESISSESVGSPVVDEKGEVVGVVVSGGDKATIRPSNTADSLLDRIKSDTKPRWPETAQAATPTPHPTPKQRLVYAPAPAFPAGMSRTGASGTGRFRLTFDARGNVTKVQVLKSTGNPYFDSSAIETLRRWRSAGGQEWEATVPVTFQSR